VKDLPTPPPPGIFISYRRADTGPYARLLQLQLSERFPGAQVFMDLDSIEAGLDFAAVIRRAVNSCLVMVALIGRQWETITATGSTPCTAAAFGGVDPLPNVVKSCEYR